MLGYVHLLPETRPALERRTVAGTALWVLEGDLDGGLLPHRRLRRCAYRSDRGAGRARRFCQRSSPGRRLSAWSGRRDRGAKRDRHDGLRAG